MSKSRPLIKANNILDVRSAFRQATHHLVVNHKLSPQEARKWILQEAMAKKASLKEVAKAIITGEMIEYRYNVPV